MASGKTEEVVEQYLRQVQDLAFIPLHLRKDRTGIGYARMVVVNFGNATNPSLGTLKCGDQLLVELTYESDRELHEPAFMVGIFGQLRQSIYRLDSAGAGGL